MFKPIKIRPIKFKPISFGSQWSSKRTLGKIDREILYQKAKGHCEGCGKKIDYADMQVGHKKAYSKGGATTHANSSCLCYTCNKHQGTGSLETLKKKLAGTYGKRTKKSSRKKASKQKTQNSFGLNFSNPLGV